MSILVTTRVPLRPLPAPIGGAPPTPTSKELEFTRWQQEETQWCWAACAGSIAAYYDPTSHWTQCSIVCALLGVNSCCANGSDDSCNQPGYLDHALELVGRFDPPIVSNAMMWSELVAEIVTNEPIGVRIQWASGGGHFVVIDGFDSSGATQRVDVQDPWDGYRRISYDDLCSNYPGSGSWTHSYKTAA
jgi:hypothetical protein